MYMNWWKYQLPILQIIIDGWLREGSIRCPPCEDMCIKTEQWRGPSPIKNCLPDEQLEEPGEEDVMDQPCAAASFNRPSLLFLLISITYAFTTTRTVINQSIYGSPFQM